MTEPFEPLPPANAGAERPDPDPSARPGAGVYRALFEANPQPMWVYDIETLAFLAVNNAAVREYGYSRDEFLAMTIKDIRPVEDLPALLELLAEVSSRQGSDLDAVPAGTWRHRRKDGSLLDAEVFSQRLLFQGREARVVVVHDVTDQKRAAEALVDREQQLSEAQRLAHLGSWEWDIPNGVRWSDEMYRILGVDPAGVDVTHATALSFVHPDEREVFDAALQRTMRTQEEFKGDVRIVRPDGEVRRLACRARVVTGPDGQPLRLFGTAQDVTEQRRLEEALEERARLGLLSVDVATALADDDPTPEMLRKCCEAMVEHLDAAFARIWTVSDDGEVLELQASAGPYTHVDGGHARIPVGAFKIGMIAERREPHLTNSVIGDDRVDQDWAAREGVVAFAGYPLEIEDRLIGVMAVFARRPLSDAVLAAMAPAAKEIAVGIERKRNEAALAHQALHDSLTGLPNRSLMIDRLDQALARCRRRQSRCAVMLLDLDHFKVVNESRGHSFGDRLLVAVSQRLREVVRPTDTVARFGGDEFVLLCEDVVSEWEASIIGQRVSAALEEPFVSEGHEHFLTASFGIVLVDPASGPDAILRDADSAMYQAKQLGRARTAFFDESFTARAAARAETETGLRRAVDRGEFSLVYQPMIVLDEGRIVGSEALIRWEHPDRGTVPPGSFIPLAEETGLIVPIGAWVLSEACRQSRRWRDANGGRAPLGMSVNLSARQLLMPDFLDFVAETLAENAMDPATLHLEITETVLMGDAEFYVQTLTALKALGVRLAIDDFGTGYSSLSYLRRFPIDKIKVDQSFVSGPSADGQQWPIVSAIIGMAQALGRVVLAEGIETAEQLATLRGLGCQFGQGYYFARPMPANQFAELLASEPRW